MAAKRSSAGHVLAGSLPPGAVDAFLRDRNGDWHQTVSRDGYQLCALPQRPGRKPPPLEYRDGAGNAFRTEVDPGPGLPVLWPAQADGAPRLLIRHGPPDQPPSGHVYCNEAQD